MPRVAVDLSPGLFRRADANADGRVDISDGIHTLANLFIGGPRARPPGIFDCGLDPTPDALDCLDDPTCV